MGVGGEFQAESEGGREKKSEKTGPWKHGKWSLVRRVKLMDGGPAHHGPEFDINGKLGWGDFWFLNQGMRRKQDTLI